MITANTLWTQVIDLRILSETEVNGQVTLYFCLFSVLIPSCETVLTVCSVCFRFGWQIWGVPKTKRAHPTKRWTDCCHQHPTHVRKPAVRQCKICLILAYLIFYRNENGAIRDVHELSLTSYHLFGSWNVFLKKIGHLCFVCHCKD